MFRILIFSLFRLSRQKTAPVDFINKKHRIQEGGCIILARTFGLKTQPIDVLWRI